MKKNVLPVCLSKKEHTYHNKYLTNKLNIYIFLLFFACFQNFASAQLTSAIATAESTKICQGDSTHLHLELETIGTPQLTVKWTPNYFINSDTVDSPIIKPKQSTVYQAVVTDINNNISLTTKVTISVVPKPIVHAPDNSSVCANESYDLSPIRFDNSLKPAWYHNGEGYFLPSPDSLNVTYIPGKNELGDVEIILVGKGIDFCQDVSDTTIIKYTDATEVNIIEVDSFICANNTLSIKAEAKNYNSFNWGHNGDGELLNSNTLNPVYVPNINEFGKVKLILEAFGNVCNKSDTVNFTIGLSPEIKLPLADTFCNHEPIKIETLVFDNVKAPIWYHNGTGEFTYSNDSSMVNYIPDLNELGKIMIGVLSGSADNCGQVADTTYLYLTDPTNALILNTDTFLCGNEQIELFGEAENFQSFEWKHNGNGNLINETTLNPTYIPDDRESRNIEFILKAFGSFCNDADTINFTLGLSPEIKLPLADTFCNHELIKIETLVFDNVKAPIWYHNGTGEFTYSNDSSMVNYIPGLNELGEIMIGVSSGSADNCGQVADTTYLYLTDPTNALILNTDTFLCGNEQIELFGEAENFQSFEWKHNGNGNLINETTLNPTYIPDDRESRNIEFILKAFGSFCNDADTINFTIGLSPEIKLPLADTFCNHEPIKIETLVFDNVKAPIWYHNGTGEFTYSNDSSMVNYIPGLNELGKIMIGVLSGSADNCGQVADTTYLYLTDPTNALILNTDTFLCGNEQIELFGEAENFQSFEWKHNGNGNLINETTLNPTYIPDDRESRNIEFILKAFGSFCNDADTINFTLGLSPEIKLPLADTFCNHEPIKIETLVFDNVKAPIWSHNGTGEFTYSNDSSMVNYIPDLNELGKIMIGVSSGSADNCGQVADTTYLYLTDPTNALILNTDTFLCGNEQIELFGEAENFQSFEWKHNGNGNLINENTLNPTYIPDDRESGNVEIILEVFGSACNDADTISIEVSSIFMEFNQEVFACEGDKVVLSIAASPSFDFSWNTGQFGNQILVDAIFSENYVATVTNSDNCSSEAIIRLEIYEKPIVEISADIENKILTAFPAGLNKYEFFDNRDNLLYSGPANVFNYSELPPQTESIYVIGYNEFGCAGDKEADYNNNIFIIPLMDWVNAFSPNNDGINDRLLPGRRTKVFDRTSKILYDGWDGWDGTYKGKEMPEGTYFYLLYDGNDIYYKGPVSILR